MQNLFSAEGPIVARLQQQWGKLPPQIGYFIADRIADTIVRIPNNSGANAIRNNLSTVLAQPPESLDRLVQHTYRNIIREAYDVCHYTTRPEELAEVYVRDESVEDLINTVRERPNIVIAFHLKGMHFCSEIFSEIAEKAYVLAMQNPPAVNKSHNEYREKKGFSVNPTGFQTLKEALVWLEAGNTIATAIDRPVAKQKYYPQFFGHPSRINGSLASLAMRRKIDLWAIELRTYAGKTLVKAKGPYHLNNPWQHGFEALLAEVYEPIIREHPERWLMPHEIWPSLEK